MTFERTRRLASGVALTLSASLLLSACASTAPAPTAATPDGSAPAEFVRGEVLRLGILQEPLSWDPSQAHVGHLLQPYQAVYDTLILREPDGTLSPMLATEWSYNEDLTELTLELRDDVTFSDGEAFDADAVKANVENFKAGNGRQAAQLGDVESVTVVDADTVVLELSQPNPAMEYFLSQAAGLMGSPASIGTEGIATLPVGSGPYVMEAASSVPGSQYVFSAREGYWNADLQKFNRLEMKVLADVTARVNALVSGQIDATLVDARTSGQVEAAGKTLSANQVDWTGLLLLDRDGKLAPALADVRVRQAINHALDRATMLEQIQLGAGTVTHQVFGPESGAYVDALDERYPYDPAKARKLLSDAGYADGFELTIPTFPGLESIVPLLTQQFADVGITLIAESVPPQNIQADIAGGKFPAAYFFLFQGEPWVAINQMISTEATYNAFDSTSPELQALIDEVRLTGTQSNDAAQKINEYVTENAWFAPLYRLDQMYFYDPKTITSVPQTQMAVPSIYNYSPVQK
jgi:peptide/nickel transport system substrate-binding protein